MQIRDFNDDSISFSDDFIRVDKECIEEYKEFNIEEMINHTILLINDKIINRLKSENYVIYITDKPLKDNFFDLKGNESISGCYT